MRGVSGGYWEWMGLAGDSYSVFVDLDETRRLASSPPVVDDSVSLTKSNWWNAILCLPIQQRSQAIFHEEPLLKRRRLTRSFTSLASATLKAERERGDDGISPGAAEKQNYCFKILTNRRGLYVAETGRLYYLG